MTPRQPVTARRLATVMSATLAAVITTALIAGPSHPFPALLIIAGILAASSAVLPSPAWSWWLRLAGTPLRAARERKRRHASAEYALWMDRLRLDAQRQRDAKVSGCHDGFCGCGIPDADWERFGGELEVLARLLWSPERGHQ